MITTLSTKAGYLGQEIRDGVKILTGIVFSNVAITVVPKVVRQVVIYVSANAGPSLLAGKGCHRNYFNAAYQNDNLDEVVGSGWFRKGARYAPTSRSAKTCWPPRPTA
jgi:hypothetical protein